jgi:hypothetical protein
VLCTSSNEVGEIVVVRRFWPARYERCVLVVTKSPVEGPKTRRVKPPYYWEVERSTIAIGSAALAGNLKP